MVQFGVYFSYNYVKGPKGSLGFTLQWVRGFEAVGFAVQDRAKDTGS